MHSQIYAKIRANPAYQDLVKRRSRFAWTLASIVFVVFYGLVLTVAFAPSFIGERVAPGSTLTVGVAAGLFVFISFWLLTALYVRRANAEFDAITQQVLASLAQEKAR